MVKKLILLALVVSFVVPMFGCWTTEKTHNDRYVWIYNENLEQAYESDLNFILLQREPFDMAYQRFSY